VFEDLGIQLENVQLKDMGRAKKVKIDKDNTTIIEGAGKKQAVQGRIQMIQRELEKSSSDYDKEKLSERIAKLSGGVAKINVGAATESEMKEKKARVEDAMHATRAANQEGIIDPTKVVRSALENAASVSTLLLTSDALVADAPKEEKKAGGGGGGYEDMY